MHKVAFEWDIFGLLDKPFKLHSYGLLIATGFLIGMMLAKRQAEREGEDPDTIVDISFYLLLFGLLGSRFIYILTQWDVYSQDPIKILQFWTGGLVFYGAPIGAGLYLLWFTRRYELNFFKVADILMPSLALGHVFGRFGCLCAGCCYGAPLDAAWAIQMPDLPTSTHPSPLYEAGAELIMFVLLTQMRPYKRFHGQLLLTWLACYSVIRVILEHFRGDKIRGVYKLIPVDWMPAFSTSQYISFAVGILAVILYVHIIKKRQSLAGQ